MKTINSIILIVSIALLSACSSTRSVQHIKSENLVINDEQVIIKNQDSLLDEGLNSILTLNQKLQKEQYESILSEYFDLELDSNGNEVYRPVLVIVLSTRSVIRQFPGTDSIFTEEVEMQIRVPKINLTPISFLMVDQVEIEGGKVELSLKTAPVPKGVMQLLQVLDQH